MELVVKNVPLSELVWLGVVAAKDEDALAWVVEVILPNSVIEAEEVIAPLIELV